jgi:hypothetical protein
MSPLFLFLDYWQGKRNRRAGGFVLYPDVTAMRFDQSFADRQPQPCPFTKLCISQLPNPYRKLYTPHFIRKEY